MTKDIINRLHVVCSNDRFLFFDPGTLCLMEGDKTTAQIVKLYRDKIGPRAIASQLGISPSLVNETLNLLSDHFEGKQGFVKPVKLAKSPHLTMYLNVSGECNLRCEYCYADFGNYLEPCSSQAMDIGIAKSAFDRFVQTYGKVGRIIFFGGEPWLSEDLMKECCDYCIQQSKKLGAAVPVFGMVTNGTLLTEKRIDFLKAYNVGITVSLDGPKEIHDQLRRDIKGNGSYSQVEKGIDRLRQRGINPGIQCTYTSRHIQLGLSPKMLLAFFQKRFETPFVNLASVAVESGNSLSVLAYGDEVVDGFREAMRFSLASFASEKPIVLKAAKEYLSVFEEKIIYPPSMPCHAIFGRNVVAVSTDGNVYPCEMFNGQPEFVMGSVSDKGLTQTQRFTFVQKYFQNLDRAGTGCSQCWARNMCILCLAHIKSVSGALFPVPQFYCNLTKALLEEVIVFVWKHNRQKGTV